MTLTTIRRIIWQWQAWRARRRLARSIPGYAETAAEIAARRKCHRATRDVMQRQRELLHKTLRGA